MSVDENVNYEYVFEWKIENFSYCWMKHEKPIVSPVFSAESIEHTKWKLQLYPKGCEQGNVSYFLYRETNDKGPALIDIYFDLIFLKDDGTVFERINTKNEFKEGGNFGYRIFVKQKVIYEEEKALYLLQDTLTVRCKLRKSCEKATKIVEQFASTVIGVEQKSFDWSIVGFNEMAPDEKKSLSVKLSNGDHLNLDLFLSSSGYTKEVILVSITPFLKKIKFVILKLFLRDAEGNMVECCQRELYGDLNCVVFPLNLTKKKVLRKKHSYLKDDKLSLCCVCAFTTGIAFEGVGRTISRNLYEQLPQNNVEDENTSCLGNDLKSLLNNITLSDITLCTETGSYPAHMAILSARSPVFKAMFTSDMKEVFEKKVNIPDVNGDTVQQMLLYMYTDTLEEILQWESLLLLYEAADKYNIMSLKKQCATCIEKLLRSNNVCEAILLADRHDDEDFKRILHNYIVNNQQDVLDLKEWKLFMKSNSELAAEILFKICLEE